jgi:hypothetical protein
MPVVNLPEFSWPAFRRYFCSNDGVKKSSLHHILCKEIFSSVLVLRSAAFCLEKPNYESLSCHTQLTGTMLFL